MNILIKIVRGIANGLAWIGAGLIGIIMILTALDALGRYFFNYPLTGTLEVSESSIVIVIFFTVAYCQFTGGHIQVGLIVDRLSGKVKVIAHYLSTIAAIIYFGLLSWQSGLVALYAFKIKETSWGSYPIPLYPAKFAVCVGTGIMCIYLILELVTIDLSKFEKPKS